MTECDIPIKNWFDYTNFNEVEFNWSIGSEKGSITDLNIEPHAEGVLTIPARNWQDGEVLNIKCMKAGKLIDEFSLPIGKVSKTFPAAKGPAPEISEDALSITVKGKDFRVIFDKSTGQITEGSYKGSVLIIGGPRLNMVLVALPMWKLTDIVYSIEGNEAVVSISGSYDNIEASFRVRIDGTGLITTDYTVTNPPEGAFEIGIIFDMPESVDRLIWDRDGLWSVYPSDHIGRNTGMAYRVIYQEAIYQKSGLTDGEHIIRVVVSSGIIVVGGFATDESYSTGKLAMIINNEWDYSDIAWGNYLKPLQLASGYTNTVAVRLTDNDLYLEDMNSKQDSKKVDQGNEKGQNDKMMYIVSSILLASVLFIGGFFGYRLKRNKS